MKKILFLIFCTAVWLLPAGPLRAQQAPPPGGEPKPFTLPDKTTLTLDNGLDVTLVPYGALPKVTVRAVVRTGNIHEGPEEVWLADLMGDLMKEGTTTRTAEDIAREAADMGGSVEVAVGVDQSFVSGDVLSEYGPALVELIADILQHPAFPASELDRLKRDRIRQVSIARTQPGTLALETFRSVLYGDHPYGRLFPTEAMLQSYTVEDIRRFYEENVGAGRTHVYVVGRFDEAAMEDAIRTAFGDWARGSEPALPLPQPRSERAVHLVDLPGAAQSNVYIGLPVIDPSHEDYVALQVTNALLGGSFASRITSNIREDKGYTYSPYSTVSARYRDAYWAEIAAVTTSVTGPAIQEIFNEIERLRAEPPSPDELEGIQNYLAGTFVLQNSSRSGIIGQLAFLDLHGLDDDYLRTYVQRVYAVTPEEVQRIAQTYLNPEDMVIVIAGDVAQIQDQVDDFGPLVP